MQVAAVTAAGTGPWSEPPLGLDRRTFRVKGLGFTWTPKVCKIMALYGCYYGFRAIILHTFGV